MEVELNQPEPLQKEPERARPSTRTWLRIALLSAMALVAVYLLLGPLLCPAPTFSVESARSDSSGKLSVQIRVHSWIGNYEVGIALAKLQIADVTTTPVKCSVFPELQGVDTEAEILIPFPRSRLLSFNLYADTSYSQQLPFRQSRVTGVAEISSSRQLVWLSRLGLFIYEHTRWETIFDYTLVEISRAHETIPFDVPVTNY